MPSRRSDDPDSGGGATSITRVNPRGGRHSYTNATEPEAHEADAEEAELDFDEAAAEVDAVLNASIKANGAGVAKTVKVTIKSPLTDPELVEETDPEETDPDTVDKSAITVEETPSDGAIDNSRSPFPADQTVYASIKANGAGVAKTVKVTIKPPLVDCELVEETDPETVDKSAIAVEEKAKKRNRQSPQKASPKKRRSSERKTRSLTSRSKSPDSDVKEATTDEAIDVETKAGEAGEPPASSSSSSSSFAFAAGGAAGTGIDTDKRPAKKTRSDSQKVSHQCEEDADGDSDHDHPPAGEGIESSSCSSYVAHGGEDGEDGNGEASIPVPEHGSPCGCSSDCNIGWTDVGERTKSRPLHTDAYSGDFGVERGRVLDSSISTFVFGLVMSSEIYKADKLGLGIVHHRRSGANKYGYVFLTGRGARIIRKHKEELPLLFLLVETFEKHGFLKVRLQFYTFGSTTLHFDAEFDVIRVLIKIAGGFFAAVNHDGASADEIEAWRKDGKLVGKMGGRHIIEKLADERVFRAFSAEAPEFAGRGSTAKHGNIPNKDGLVTLSVIAAQPAGTSYDDINLALSESFQRFAAKADTLKPGPDFISYEKATEMLNQILGFDRAPLSIGTIMAMEADENKAALENLVHDLLEHENEHGRDEKHNVLVVRTTNDGMSLYQTCYSVVQAYKSAKEADQRGVDLKEYLRTFRKETTAHQIYTTYVSYLQDGGEQRLRAAGLDLDSLVDVGQVVADERCAEFNETWTRNYEALAKDYNEHGNCFVNARMGGNDVNTLGTFLYNCRYAYSIHHLRDIPLDTADKEIKYKYIAGDRRGLLEKIGAFGPNPNKRINPKEVEVLHADTMVRAGDGVYPSIAKAAEATVVGFKDKKSIGSEEKKRITKLRVKISKKLKDNEEGASIGKYYYRRPAS